MRILPPEKQVQFLYFCTCVATIVHSIYCTAESIPLLDKDPLVLLDKDPKLKGMYTELLRLW